VILSGERYSQPQDDAIFYLMFNIATASQTAQLIRQLSDVRHASAVVFYPVLSRRERRLSLLP
jgi:uncharacterized PurR-regulated membrane protein YhhQ (DUF165 family)